MSFLDFLSGIVMPSDPLGNNGGGGLTGRLPFIGGRREFQDGRGGRENGIDFGLIDPFEEKLNRERMQAFGFQSAPGPMGTSPAVPGFPQENRPLSTVPTDHPMDEYPNAYPDVGYDRNTGRPLPPNGIGEHDRLFTPAGWLLGANNNAAPGQPAGRSGTYKPDEKPAPVPGPRSRPGNDNGNVVPLKIGAFGRGEGFAVGHPGEPQNGSTPWNGLDHYGHNDNKNPRAGIQRIDPVSRQLEKMRDLLKGDAGSDSLVGSAGALEQLVNSTTPHIIQAESGGKANAKNPLSSAGGLGQFTRGTWNALVKSHPELNLTPDEGRFDKAQAKRGLAAFGLDNAHYLARNGLPTTPGTLYIAHFLGNGGASDVLSSPDTVPMSQAVPQAVMAANPFLKGMTVGSFKAWAERKMGGKVSPEASAAGASGPLGKAFGTGFAGGAGESSGGIPLEDNTKSKKAPNTAPEFMAEALQPGVEPEHMSHADRLAILRQFMALAGFTSGELG